MDDKLIRVAEAIDYLVRGYPQPYNKEKPYADFLTDVVEDAINGDDAIMSEMVMIGACVLCVSVWIDIALGGFIISNSKPDDMHKRIKDAMLKYYGDNAFFLTALAISELDNS